MFQNRKPAKVPLKSRKPVDQAIRCLYCKESYDESTGKWVQCTKCKSGQNTLVLVLTESSAVAYVELCA